MPTLGERLVEWLAAYDVDTVFGIPGVHTVEMYRGLAASPLHHVTPRHEQGAGFMADGYARVTGRPGVAFVNKYGMTFILDRQTGKPLLPIPEVKVPQSTALDVNTWPTQPIPMADNVLGNRLDASAGALSRRLKWRTRSTRKPLRSSSPSSERVE